MKVLMDMNLSPVWVEFLQAEGIEAIHWSSVGDPRAIDRTLFDWASGHGHVVFTHDMDFGTLLALTNAASPSVVQVRTQDITPQAVGHLVVNALRQFQDYLDRGALVVLDEGRARARILPIGQ